MLYALLAIVIVAPFERVLVTIPGGLAVTSVEAMVLIGLAAALFSLGPRRLVSHLHQRQALPGVVFLAVTAVAAALTPFEQGNALRFAMRMLVAAVLVIATRDAVRSRQDARLVVATLLAVATTVAVIAILEAAQVPAVMAALTSFRPGFHVVAGQLRATSTLFYPTIASMYLELAFALGLWLLLEPSGRYARRERALVFASLVLIGAGISATFTRAGLIAMAVAIVAVAALRLSRVSRADAGLGRLTALATTLIIVVLVAHSPELLATRISTEGSAAWYGARYEVPKTLSLRTGAVHRVPVTLTNTGRLPWSSSTDPAFALSYHWLRAGSEAVVVFEGQRTPFPQVVQPRASVTVEADVIAPAAPGEYTLVWDVVHETRAWLSTEGVAAARTHARVTGAPLGVVETSMPRLPGAPPRPARPALWSAALQIARAHPWLGIGPDNYRLAYGSYLGLPHWDRRIHANNMYLEMLAGAGLGGLCALLWLVGSAGWALWQRVRHAGVAAHLPAAAAFATWIVVAGHGLVDSFLSFTTTYVMFAVAAGLAFSSGLIEPAEPHAHRV